MFVDWIWELLSIVTSLGCLAAVVVILARMQGRPLSDWTFLINLNATVALLVAASKAAAMCSIGSCFSQSKWLHFKTTPRKLEDLDLFQEASRGPLGAFFLLFTSWIWIRPILVVGSVATVLALGADTFGQLVVNIDSYQDLEVFDGHSSFGLTHVYDSGVKGQMTNTAGVNTALLANTSTTDTAMQGAIYRALFNVQSQPVFNCTSKCVWKDSYVSLGFGTNCTDVTTETHATIRQDNSTSQTGHWWNMTTPGNISLRLGYSSTSWLSLAQVAAVDLLAVYSLQVPNSNVAISPDFARFAVAAGASDQSGSEELPKDFYPAAWQVHECTISMTAYEYANVSASGNEFKMGSTTAIPLEDGHFNGTSLIFSQPNLPNMTVQGVDLAGLNAFFTSSRFSGSIFSGESRPSESTGVGEVMRKADVPTLFAKMAESMTDQLRSGYNMTATGLAVESVIFVQVRWEWFSLPLFVVIAAAIQLVYTMVCCRSDPSPLWKSSVVAVLFHELSGGGQWKDVVRTNLESVDQLKTLARRTRVTVED